MRKFFGFLVLILLGLAVALGVRFLPGYVLFQVRHFSVAAPLWMAVLAFLVSLLLLFLIGFLVRHIWHLPRQIRRYVKQQQWQKTQRLLSEHLMQFLAQDWTHAEKGFAKLAQRRYLVRSMYVFAALCAEQKGQSKRHSEYLHRANAHPKCQHDLLFQLVLVDQCIAENNWQAAEDKLQPWLIHHQRHPQVLWRYIQVCCHFGYWSKAQDVMPFLKKSRVFDEALLQQYQLKTYTGIVRQAAQQSASQLESTWLDLPKSFQSHEALLSVLLEVSQPWDMSAFLQKVFARYLKSNWTDAIFLHYCRAAQIPLQTRLSFAERWLKEETASAGNQFAMGQLYVEHENWSEAALCFHKSLELKETTAAYQALASIYTKQGKQDQALMMYEQAFKH